MTTLRDVADAYRAMPNGGASLALSQAPHGWCVSNGHTTVGPAFPSRVNACFALHNAGFRRDDDGRWRLGPVRIPAEVEADVGPSPFYGLRGD